MGIADPSLGLDGESVGAAVGGWQWPRREVLGHELGLLHERPPQILAHGGEAVRVPGGQPERNHGEEVVVEVRERARKRLVPVPSRRARHGAVVRRARRVNLVARVVGWLSADSLSLYVTWQLLGDSR